MDKYIVSAKVIPAVETCYHVCVFNFYENFTSEVQMHISKWFTFSIRRIYKCLDMKKVHSMHIYHKQPLMSSGEQFQVLINCTP